MKFSYCKNSLRSLNNLINLFWKVNLKILIRIYPVLYQCQKIFRRCFYRRRTYVICILLIIFLLSTIDWFSTEKKSLERKLEIYSIYHSKYLLNDDNIIYNIYNQSINHIYIDIGCFNGETIEHFIHFHADSQIYDIITFEPDPTNYRVCKHRLSQNKYRNYNIIIIPKAVWIRNEKVSYQTDRGEKSQIVFKKTNKNNFEHIDAIDFSSWLSKLTEKLNRTNFHIHIKMSAPDVEVLILRKMIDDSTLSLAHQWDVEWTNGSNHRRRLQRYYVQQMFESLGYDSKYLTHLSDEKKVFHMNGTYADIPKYRDWSKMVQSGTYIHYIQRPAVPDPPRTTRTNRKSLIKS